MALCNETFCNSKNMWVLVLFLRRCKPHFFILVSDTELLAKKRVCPGSRRVPPHRWEGSGTFSATSKNFLSWCMPVGFTSASSNMIDGELECLSEEDDAAIASAKKDNAK